MGWSPLPKTASECQSGECKFPLMREATTMKATTIGIDLAKHLFQLHGVDQHGKTVLKRQLKRDQMLSFFTNLPPSGVVAQISQQIMISPAPSDRYTRGFLTGRPRVFSLFIALTYAITSPT
ncbi:hypothetical protein CJI17_21465 [Aeromonas salmonicida]|nr:hypothetical protein CJI17_21465 [Aeromonas salmonicida]